MTWEAFWLPNLVQWFLGGAVTVVVGMLVRRGLTQWAQQFFGEQQRTTLAAESAATRAGEAVDVSNKAVASTESTSKAAAAAADNSRQANEVLEWLVPQVLARDAVIDELKERIDRLLGARARQLADTAQHPTGLLVPYAVGEETDPATVTGRHRLHTQRIQIPHEGDPA